MLKIKRVYDEPSSDDGIRILVDRMWPRGIKKENLKMDSWEKELAPSAELRKWYGHDPAKFHEFRERYFKELDHSLQAKDFLNRFGNNNGQVTLLFSARDAEHSNAQVLYEWICRKKANKGIRMAGENKKDFNAMLADSRDMPKIQTITDERSIKRYGGSRMYFAPPCDYDAIMKKVPFGKVITAGKIREYLAEKAGADFTDPMTAGIFISIAAWASFQRNGKSETPYWRTLKTDGELNPRYPGGIEKQKEMLESEGHTIIQRGRKNIRYYVKGYEESLFDLH